MISSKHIAIVGAGASGLFLAKKLSERRGFQVTLFEKNRQVGAKLRASGGGKANIFNR
ncbi:MAG: FAD-dependent oxidoreductase, partial [Bacteroidales bacterium]|nr:FAD-dependent oxidoreductase [Bacteroidales bacterium]